MGYNTQRDVFIAELQKYAEKDSDVILMSIDMGAPALDDWRLKLPKQFFASGISEQNSINFAAGLAAEGKKVYVYVMGSWAARCFEQIRYSCAMGNNPITFLGNGVGLGYAPAGPAHAPTEDIGYMRTINGIEVLSPSNLNIIPQIVALTYNDRKLRHVRLERNTAKEVADKSYHSISQGFDLVKISAGAGKRVCVVSSGYLLGRSILAANALTEYQIDVLDLYRIKPIEDGLAWLLAQYDYVVTVEEQTLDAGFGSAVAEFICDKQIKTKLLRLGLPARYIFENGNRDHLIDTNGLSASSIAAKIKEFVN